MKNFRKVLALILVVATLFSFVAMASAKNAEEFGDYADVQNKLAVDIIAALGITVGDNGNYRPADTIDRDEVAAMIARLRNGGAFNADLYVGAPNVFADVDGQWSEGYVTYCTQLGIIAGYNATTFNPDAQVKIVEVAKMLLCVLGFDAAEQDYVGNPNWAVAVIRDANKMGILTGITATDVYQPATRDQVALMFFNALKARLVYGYVSENIVTITNSLLGTKFYDGITSVTLPELTGAELAYKNAVISNVTLANVLKVSEHKAYDCFGRPGTMWFVGSWYKFYPAAYTAEKHNGESPVDAKKVTELYVNGAEITNVTEDVVKGYLGNGVSAEAYALGGDKFRVVVIDTVLAKVSAVSKRTGKATITAAYDSLAKTITVDAGTLAKDDVLKVHECGLYYTIEGREPIKAHADLDGTLFCPDHESGNEIHNYTVLTAKDVVVAETHVYDKNTLAQSYIQTADGTKYQYSKWLGHDVNVEADVIDAATKGKTVRLWLDDFGYIQDWAVVEPGSTAPTTDVAYFVEGTNKFTTIHEGTDVPQGTHVYSATADIVKMDTSKANIAITIDDTRLSQKDLDDGKLEDTYTIMWDRGNVDTKGTKYDGVFARYNTANGQMTQVATVAGQDTWLNKATGELENATAPSGLNYHFTADTNFLVRTWDIATGAPTYEAVKGYLAMPEYLGKLIFGEDASYNTIQFLADGNYITDLFIDAYYVKTAAEYVYIVEKVKDIGVAGLGKYYHDFAYYRAFINGADAYVAYFNVDATDNNDAWTAADLKDNTLYQTAVKGINATYDGAPIYVAMTQATFTPWASAKEYKDVIVKPGQIELVDKDGKTAKIDASKYLDELSVYVLSGADDVPYAIMNGTEFIKKYQADPEFKVAVSKDVFAMGSPISILILTIE